MTAWNSDEIRRLERSDELQIAPRRQDGSLREPVTIWVVRHGDDAYVRSYRGKGSAWYRNAKARREGHIRASGVERDVMFVPVRDPDTNAAVDAAYRGKYRGYGPSYVDPMLAEQARSTTLRLVPR